MSLMLAERFDVEDVFWARPLPLSAMILIFAAVVLWSLYLYRRSVGLRSVTALRAWHRPFVGAFSDRFCAL